MIRLIPMLALAACAADELDLNIHSAALGATCLDGTADDGELCIGTPTQITNLAMARVVLVDLNGDGRRDIAAISQIPSRTFVRFATATGWGAWGTWTVPASQYEDLTTGDFDGDGDPDLAIADFANDRVLVHWNPGTGILAAPAAYPVGDGPVRVLAGRLDGDGRVDLVTLDRNAATATVRLANAGGFAAPVAYPIGDAPDIALGNCDNVVRPDLLYSNSFGTNHRVVARRNLQGTGSFGPPIVSPLPLPPLPLGAINRPQAIAAGTLNGDALADVAIPTDDSWIVPAVSVGACTFVPDPSPLVQTWAYVKRSRVIDLDGDGELDLIAPHMAGAISAVFGNGGGGFDPRAEVLMTELFVAPQNVWDVAVGDVTGDGVLDYVLAGDAGIHVSRGVP